MNTKPPVELKITQHDAHIRVTGPYDPDIVQLVRDAFANARDYYFTRHLVLEIESPGGSVHVCQALLHEMQMWRADRRTIATHATMQAASAGAYTLSMGDVGHRTVMPYTELTYHNSRVSLRQATITSQAAQTLSEQMEALDEAFMDRLAAHITGSFSSVQDFASAGLKRVDCLAQNLRAVTPHILHGHRPGKRSTLTIDLSKIRTVYARCLKTDSFKPYQDLLKALWSADQPVFTPNAWAMLLIDAIESVPLLSPPVDLAPEPAVRDQEEALDQAALQAIQGVGKPSTMGVAKLAA